MNHQCTNCSTSFEITDEDLDFYDRVSPMFSGKKFSIPAPTLCPECRQQRRLTHINEHHFYQGECGLCNKKTLTQWSPESGKTIYCQKCWHSDKWDPCEYGRDIDFTKSFFDQFQILMNEVPVIALLTEGECINSEYIHYAGYAKNCYLISHADYCEDCYYGYGFKHATSCVDGFYNLYCELCYDTIDCHKCYKLVGSQDCSNCSTSAFLRDCTGCKDCFLCTGLRGKEYCFENKQLTKQEYQAAIAEIDLTSYAQYTQCHSRLKALSSKHIFKEFQGMNRENCSGNHVNNCKNTIESFDCEDTEDCKFCYQMVIGAKDCYDMYQYGSKISQSYECCIAGNDSYNILFSHNAHGTCSEVLYCWYAITCKNCFGCASMHNKKFCILNKQYTEVEYNALAPKLIEHMQSTGEWGEFFPSRLSPFGYNKTSAQMYYPLTKKDAIESGFYWDDFVAPPPNVARTITAGQLPDSSTAIPDDILNWAIECKDTGVLFRITPHELRFYREQNLPIPRTSPQKRHLDRFAKRNPRTFFERTCDKCSMSIQTTFSPEREEKVYCEECYLQEVY